MRRRTPPIAVALALALAVPLAACSAGEDTGAEVTATAASSEPSAVAEVPVTGPDGNALPVPAPIAVKWRATGGVSGPLGPARGPAVARGSTRRVDFRGGSVFATDGGRAFIVQGEILRVYDREGGPEGELGAPVADEASTDGGWISVFEGGTITFIDGRAEVTTK